MDDYGSAQKVELQDFGAGNSADKPNLSGTQSGDFEVDAAHFAALVYDRK